jgi:hypothetical protein
VAFLVTVVVRGTLLLKITCVLLCAAPLFAQSAPRSDKPADYDDPEGYTILSVLLGRYHLEGDKTLQISPVTAPGTSADSFQACGGKIPAEFAAAAEDFRDKNRLNWRLAKKFNLKFSYKFSDLKGKHQPLAPTQNAKGLPPPLFEDTVYQVSAVGFDASRTHAIAYVAGICGPDCTSGAYHLLAREKEGWKEIPSSPVCEWMSFNPCALFDRTPS